MGYSIYIYIYIYIYACSFGGDSADFFLYISIFSFIRHQGFFSSSARQPTFLLTKPHGFCNPKGFGSIPSNSARTFGFSSWNSRLLLPFRHTRHQSAVSLLLQFDKNSNQQKTTAALFTRFLVSIRRSAAPLGKKQQQPSAPHSFRISSSNPLSFFFFQQTSLCKGMVGLSLAETHFIKGGIAQDLRTDGRKRLTFRPIYVETGVIPQANGSARVKLGATDVIASIKAEIGRPNSLQPDKGKVSIFVDCSPIAAPVFE